MIVLAIDPGPSTCGVVLYDTKKKTTNTALKPCAKVDVFGVLCLMDSLHNVDLVAIERVQSSGFSGASLLETSEVVGRLQQRALDCGLRVVLLYRRVVCSRLHVHGAGKDKQVRERMIEMHGGSERAVGRKANPGPLYGVTSHSWQALGLAVVAAEIEEESIARARAVPGAAHIEDHNEAEAVCIAEAGRRMRG